MADNIELDAGSGGATVAADDVGGVHYQVVKIDVGGDGASAPLSTTNPIPVSDAGGALTVDGTVAVTNAGLTELAAAINASSQVDVNIAASGATVAVSHAALTELAAAIDTELQVDVVSSALPTGAATAANQTTIIGHVDGIEGLLTTIDADTGGILTAVQTLDNAISGNEMQVDVLTIAAGDNNIGNVDVASSALPTGAATSANQRGASHYRNVDANAEAEIKGSAGTLVWLHAMNMTAAVAYVHLYDALAANVTPGSTTPTYTFPVGTAGDTNGAGFFARIDQAFATGITLVVTTTIDGSAGDPGTNGVFINAGYT